MSITNETQLTPPGSRKAPPSGPATAETAPQLFSYTDYRVYLDDWFQFRKRENPAYSGALFARRAGLSAHTLLGMVIRGQRNLSHETIRAFGRALDLTGRKALFFEKLVLFNQSKKPDDKSFYLEQLISVSQGEGRTLLTRIRSHATYFSHWYVVAIRELVAVEGFRPDPEWIRDRLKGKVTRKQVDEAWGLLNELGMVAAPAGPDGGWSIVHPAIDIDPGQADFAIRGFHRQYLDRARSALDDEPLDERELSSLTLSVSDAELPLVRQRVKDFRKALNRDFTGAKGEPRRHVLAVNMQLLVLTDSLNKGDITR